MLGGWRAAGLSPSSPRASCAWATRDTWGGSWAHRPGSRNPAEASGGCLPRLAVFILRLGEGRGSGSAKEDKESMGVADLLRLDLRLWGEPWVELARVSPSDSSLMGPGISINGAVTGDGDIESPVYGVRGVVAGSDTWWASLRIGGILRRLN